MYHRICIGEERCLAAEYCRVEERKPILTIWLTECQNRFFYVNLTFILENHDS